MSKSLFGAIHMRNLLLAASILPMAGRAIAGNGADLESSLFGKQISAQAYADGTYSISATRIAGPVIRSDVEAMVDSNVLKSTTYPTHHIEKTEFHDASGGGSTLTITHSGLVGKPDLVCTLTIERDRPWGEMTVTVRNTTHRTITVQSIRSVHATAVNLGAPESAYRILSDSFSEDRPQLAILDLGAGAHGVHRAAGSQLIYNRHGGESLFFGALTSERLLTLFHLRAAGKGDKTRVASYDIDATGTTEILKEESLKFSPPAEQVALSLPVAAGEALASERLMFSVGNDYHAQLEEYGRVVGRLHQARVQAPTPIGWWSWTAYYFGVNQGSMTTNADWLSQNLRQLGYSYFQIDEGYQYARGEYTTADASRFPEGLAHIVDVVRHDGLTFGLWTAPFEVSERAWVYQNHRDWLVHNAAGAPIHIGHVTEKRDPLFVLDTTNPGAQEYLRQTYTALRDWGVRFIKMDFMDDTAIEGSYFRPNTTAMEAQRIGLQIIRNAVGDGVVLDKDGSPMLNPVGLVDAGRISQDTGHTFEATRDAASGVAARYYMNRNFFISDPDAYTVSTQTVDDQSWHGGQRPLTLDEAQVSIALSAVSGGMFEIGDDLPTLGASPERMLLVKNPDLIDMAKLGRASIPTDLMAYTAADQQPSVFFLKESSNQAMLTVFNWTDGPRARLINLAQLGLKEAAHYRMVDVFTSQDCCQADSGVIRLEQKPHSVRVIKIIDSASPSAPPLFELSAPATGAAGQGLTFKATAVSSDTPILAVRWDFGDGSSGEGADIHHTYTHSGDYQVSITATGLNSATATKISRVAISGEIRTLFDPAQIQRRPAPSF